MKESLQKAEQREREMALITNDCLEKILNGKIETHPQTQNSGIITGSLSYPSESLPENMTICAFNTITKTQYCTNKHPSDSRYKYGKGYKLVVPPGDYYLYYKLDPNEKAIDALYGEIVNKLGYSDTIKPFLVRIREGITYTPKVDPDGWRGRITGEWGGMYLQCEELK